MLLGTTLLVSLIEERETTIEMTPAIEVTLEGNVGNLTYLYCFSLRDLLGKLTLLTFQSQPLLLQILPFLLSPEPLKPFPVILKMAYPLLQHF